MTPQEFQSKVANARELDFGTIFNQSIELFKKSWLHGFLMQLFVMILMLPLIIVLYVPMIMMLIAQSESGQMDPNAMSGLFAGFSIVYILLFCVGVLAVGGIQVALIAAFFRILSHLDQGQMVKTSDMFFFLKGRYLGKIFLLMFVTILIALPAVLFFYLPFIYVMVPMSFFSLVFAFNPEWSIGDIVGSSFRLGNKKWVLTFGLLLVSYVAVMVLSMVSCGLGGLFFAPFMYHPIFYIYKGTVGFDDLSELNRIGEREFL